MAISRSREYEADRVGAAILRQPTLAGDRAGRKYRGFASRIDYDRAEQKPAKLPHMFIINPLHVHKRDKLFSTHPNTENRISALMKLAAEQGQSVERGRNKPLGVILLLSHSLRFDRNALRIVA